MCKRNREAQTSRINSADSDPLAVLGTHLVVMNTWYALLNLPPPPRLRVPGSLTVAHRGVINSFGVFQSYYVDSLHRPPSDISWIGSVEIFLLFFIGAATGRLTDAGFFRPLFLTGAVLIVGGALATSASSQYWQILLAQGVCVGLGNGCLFCPAVAVVSTYFRRRRSLAFGLGAVGSSTGGILFPVMVRQLLPRIGFEWTIRAIALVQAVLLAVAFLCLRPRIEPRRTGRLIEWAAFKEAEYILYTLACFTVRNHHLFALVASRHPLTHFWQCFWGTYFAFFYIATYSRDVQGMSYIDSLNLLLVVNGVGIVGRILPNVIADRCGTLTIFIPTAAASALIMFAWTAISSVNGLYAWAAICGIPIGGIQSMFPSALAALTTDPRKQGTRIGMVFTVVSFSVLTGPPIEGSLISVMGGQYLAAQLFAGANLLLGTIFLVATRETKRSKIGLGLLAKI